MLADFLRSHAELIGLWAGAFTTISFAPQLIKAWKTGGEGLSWAMLTLFGVGVGLWVVYGVLRASPAVIIANVLTEAQVVIIFFLKVRHARLLRARRTTILSDGISDGASIAEESALP